MRVGTPRADVVAAVMETVASSRRFLGSFIWAIQETNYGLWNAAGVQFTDISATFAAGPTTFWRCDHRSCRRPRRLPLGRIRGG